MNKHKLCPFVFDYEHRLFDRSAIVNANCFEWLRRVPEAVIHAVVTDPPYGVKEYEPEQMEKRANNNGGIWRQPPCFDGHKRSPLPRFTALNPSERIRIQQYFSEWAGLVFMVLRPGGHMFLASNAFLSHLVFSAIAEQGFEFRGQIIRLVRTLRGGDRPKNAEEEFADVCTMPRSCYEPWGIFRKPMVNGMKVSDCLKEFQTGGLRRRSDGNPFQDVVKSERTSRKERDIANHPSLKPQSFLREIVYSSLPLGKGIVLDPFMGSGSTVAAAEAVGYFCIGIERMKEYFDMGRESVPKLSRIITEDRQLRFAA